MERFGRVLRRVDRRLEAPEPERSRILAEMAGDLKDLYVAYRERGLDEEEARRRALEWFAPSQEAVDGLRVVHTPWIERHLGRLGSSCRGWVEVGAAGLFAISAAGARVAGVLRAEIDAVLFWGGFAALLGLIGTLGGVGVMARSIEQAGSVSAPVAWFGLRAGLRRIPAGD